MCKICEAIEKIAVAADKNELTLVARELRSVGQLLERSHPDDRDLHIEAYAPTPDPIVEPPAEPELPFVSPVPAAPVTPAEVDLLNGADPLAR